MNKKKVMFMFNKYISIQPILTNPYESLWISLSLLFISSQCLLLFLSKCFLVHFYLHSCLSFLLFTSTPFSPFFYCSPLTNMPLFLSPFPFWRFHISKITSFTFTPYPIFSFIPFLSYPHYHFTLCPLFVFPSPF